MISMIFRRKVADINITSHPEEQTRRYRVLAGIVSQSGLSTVEVKHSPVGRHAYSREPIAERGLPGVRQED